MGEVVVWVRLWCGCGVGEVVVWVRLWCGRRLRV